MRAPLRLVMVEDSADDAELTLRELRRYGFDVQHERVQTSAALREALARGPWDVVLADYHMPLYSATAALADVLAVAEADPSRKVPFIILSGSIGEEAAVAALRAGAHDVLMKGHLARLGPAIERALRDVAEEAARIRAEEEAQAAMRARQAAEAASQAKSQFLAIMSHELRTPLNAIIGFTELVHGGLAGPTTPEQQSHLGDVLRASRDLLHLINEILDLATIEAGRLNVVLEATSVGAAVEVVMSRHVASAAARGITVASEIPPGLPLVSADPKRLVQIVDNLVSNAIKFSTREEKRVSITAEAVGDGVELRVSDRGSGIKEEDLPKLFRQFERLAPNRHVQGTGLGLALTARLVQLHGGEVRVASTWGEGTTMTVVLRTATSEPSEPLPVERG